MVYDNSIRRSFGRNRFLVAQSLAWCLARDRARANMTGGRKGTPVATSSGGVQVVEAPGAFSAAQAIKVRTGSNSFNDGCDTTQPHYRYGQDKTGVSYYSSTAAQQRTLVYSLETPTDYIGYG